LKVSSGAGAAPGVNRSTTPSPSGHFRCAANSPRSASACAGATSRIDPRRSRTACERGFLSTGLFSTGFFATGFFAAESFTAALGLRTALSGMSQGHLHQFGQRTHPEFAHHVGAMQFDGLDADAQDVSDY